MCIVIHERGNYLHRRSLQSNLVQGWGALIKFDTAEKEIFGGQNNTTTIKWNFLLPLRLNFKESCNVELFTDSKYVMDGITQWIQNWKK